MKVNFKTSVWHSTLHTPLGKNRGKCYAGGVLFSVTYFLHVALLWFIVFIAMQWYPMLHFFELFWDTELFWAVTAEYHVAVSWIMEIHWSPTVLSSTANGAHEFEMIVVCSSSTKCVISCQPLSRPLKLPEKEGGVSWEWLQSNLRREHFWKNIHCNRDTTRRCHK